jgi:subtilisin family serine protease
MKTLSIWVFVLLFGGEARAQAQTRLADTKIVTFDSEATKKAFCTDVHCVHTFKNIFTGALVEFNNSISVQTDVLYTSQQLKIENDHIIDQVTSVAGDAFVPLNKESKRRRGSFNESFGLGVNVYVLDTGIRETHDEFRSMLTGYSRVVKDGPHLDYYGGGEEGCVHGTHVASIATGVNLGYAIEARIFDIPIMSCFGGGRISEALMSMDWLSDNLELPAVVLLAWCSRKSQPLNTAVEHLAEKGAFIVAAACNYADDACKFSPSSSPSAVTVGSKQYSLSNYGSCVDTYALGENITGAYSGADDLYVKMSGTSMSAAYVAGVIASSLM